MTATSQRGFTLLELSLALALSGLVLVLLYSGLHLAQRSWDKGLQLAEQAQDRRVALEFFRKAVQQARPMMRRDANKLVMEFSGEPQRLLLVAPLLQNLGLGGLYWLELVQKDQDWLARLALYVPGESFDAQKPRSEVLLSGVKSLRLCYWGPGEANASSSCGADADTAEPGWRAEWRDNERPPALVRLWLEPKTGASWPPLTVAVMATPSYQASQAFLGGLR
jgi:prepilin-type N-terminal cleavage/methylation domain-containing protein